MYQHQRQEQKATALDITITDPTNKTALDSGSDRNPLVAAAVRHTVKLGTLKEAGDQGLPFTKGPLVFETTGAMEEETQKWWKSVVELEANQRIPAAPQSRREQGLEQTLSGIFRTLALSCFRSVSFVDLATWSWSIKCTWPYMGITHGHTPTYGYTGAPLLMT